MIETKSEPRRQPLPPDVYHLLRVLAWSGGGLDVRALVRRTALPSGRLRAAVNEAAALGRVRVRRRRPGRPGVPADVGDIARVVLARQGARRTFPATKKRRRARRGIEPRGGQTRRA
jgi:hypothetical protein